MVRISDMTHELRRLAPLVLAEQWDNVGLLLGDDDRDTSAVLTCLTLTPDVAEEAIRRKVGLVVAHHPILFQPIQRLTTETIDGRMLLALIQAGIGVFSPHTAYDSAQDGINQQLAESFGLTNIDVIRPAVLENTTTEQCEPGTEQSEPETSGEKPVGGGRFGSLPRPTSLGELVEQAKQVLGVERLQFVGDPARNVERLAVACGSAADFSDDALRLGCQALLTGEARFHACLEARASGFALILPGHYSTERPAVERLAGMIGDTFPEVTAWASEAESDPLQWA